MRCEYHRMKQTSGVGVLDKAFTVLDAVVGGADTLSALVEHTELSRATAHRLAVALEVHRLLARDGAGRWHLGPRAAELCSPHPSERLVGLAGPVLVRLRDATGESAQLYYREATQRRCVAAAERISGLRDTVPVLSLIHI